MCVSVIGFEDVKEAMDIRLCCCSFDFFFFWLMPIFSRLVFMTFWFMDLEPTMKFSWSDVHPGFFAFRRIFMKFSYCLDVMMSFLSR